MKMEKRQQIDKRAVVMCRVYSLHNKLICSFSAFWCRLKMRLWGIQFGKSCSFRGNMIFNRAPGSTIKMGKGCRFNSNSRFNFRGINHV